ncbi:MAG: acetyl-CoA carboxylase biotin carboxyl carrier protein [Oscillospiraceae bacterium]|nr:acetyl-CoA carboxylase biotin carboxyl carrier protein [Oscillospiraceae bacterium]
MPEKTICNLTFDEIKELAELVSDKKLGKIEIKLQDASITIEDKKRPPVQPVQQVPFQMPAVMPSQIQPAVLAAEPVSAPAAEAPKAEEKETVTGNTVKAPIVGTFYASPSPDKPAFVKVGDHVSKGDVLFIVESMKLMNEIQSEFDGTVAQILVDNASPVEYDQPVMIIK